MRRDKFYNVYYDMTPNMKRKINSNDMREPNAVQQFYSKPCLVNIEPTILWEFYRTRLIEPKTHKVYSYLCTTCCCFVPMSRDGLTSVCMTKHRQLMLKIYENELETVQLSSENDRWRVIRKNALDGYRKTRIERPPSSSAVKKLYHDEPSPKMPRLENMIIAWKDATIIIEFIPIVMQLKMYL